MKALFPVLLLASILASPARAADDDDLAPPDVTVYLEALIANSDLKPFVDQRNSGLRLRFGFRFNDTRSGPFTWSGEGGLSLVGDDSESFTLTEAINDPGSPFEEEQQLIERSARINGFELGARAEFARFFHLRGGGFIYSLTEKEDVTVTQIDQDNASNNTSFKRVPSSDTSNGVAPYLGLGASWRFDDSFSVLAEVTASHIDSEQVESAAIGIRMEF